MSRNEGASLPKTFICMIGPPRSGTTLIANTFMTHSSVSGVIEPYQRSRKDTPDYPTSISEFIQMTPAIDLKTRPNLAIKETTTRMQNVQSSLALMQSAAEAGVYTGLIIILRCPFSAFLSQVEASQNFWADRKMIEATKKSFIQWIDGQTKSLGLVFNHARKQHFRLVSYEAFCAQPRAEMARLMALIPVPLEPKTRLKLSPPKSVVSGGDPKTREKAGSITLSDRKDEIAELIKNVGDCPQMKIAKSLQSIINTTVCKQADDVTLDHLQRLLLRG